MLEKGCFHVGLALLSASLTLRKACVHECAEIGCNTLPDALYSRVCSSTSEATALLAPAVSHPQGVETIVDLQWLMGERFALWMGPLHMYLLSFWHGHWLVQGGSISPCQSWEGSQRF